MKKVFTLVLSLLSVTSFAQIPAGNMENWHNYTVDGQQLTAPDGWFGSDSAIFAFNAQLPFPLLSPQQQVFRSGTSHGGAYAARLVTENIGSITDIIAGGTLSNAQVSFDQNGITYTGGSAVTELIPYVNAWVRYEAGSGGADTASITVFAIVSGTMGDSIIGTGTSLIQETNGQYAHVSCHVSYADWSITPEKLQITFNSSASSDPQVGSTLRVDDVELATLSVRQAAVANPVKIYPNPSAGIMSVFNAAGETLTLRAFAANGQLVAEQQCSGNSLLDLTEQAPGLYFYTITNTAGETIQKGKLTIAK